MFTGIIEELARVKSITRSDKNARLCISSIICGSEANIGDSISISGACLTLAEKKRDELFFDISYETLNSTSLSKLTVNEKVNLERSLKQGGRLGGHFVTGHVDSVSEIVSKEAKGDFAEFRISIAPEIRVFLAQKGSIAVDGISLTVNSVSDDSFSVVVIPHTLSMTTLGFKGKSSLVNIETDILAKYTQNLIAKSGNIAASGMNIDRDFLNRYGFV